MTDWVVIDIRFALYLCLALQFGLPLFRLHALSTEDRAQLSQKGTATTTLVLAISSIALVISGLWVNCARMADMDVSSLDWRTVETIVMQTSIGVAWQVQLAALAISLPATLWWHRSNSVRPALLVGCAAGVALGSIAWTGHGAAGDGLVGAGHLIADIAHLLAVGVWLGALAGFVALLFAAGSAYSSDQLSIAAAALRRFAFTGSIAVAAIVLTGLVNSVLLFDITRPGLIISSPYGELLMVKLGLFTAMLALAATNRFRLTPALTQAIGTGETSAALAALRRSLAVESGTAIGILALVAWLGTLAPPGSMA